MPNDTLTEAEITLIQKAGFLPDMTAEDIEGDPEASLWIAIRNAEPETYLELSRLIQDETGWAEIDSNRVAREYRRTAQALVRLARKEAKKKI